MKYTLERRSPASRDRCARNCRHPDAAAALPVIEQAEPRASRSLGVLSFVGCVLPWLQGSYGIRRSGMAASRPLEDSWEQVAEQAGEVRRSTVPIHYFFRDPEGVPDGFRLLFAFQGGLSNPLEGPTSRDEFPR